jgi:hypothetical protein
MKKIFLSIVVIAVVVSISSCGSSSAFERDVRKKADYMCKMQKLATATDEKSVKKLEEIKKEMDEFNDVMIKKYEDKKSDDASIATAEKIMMEVMEKCK